LATGRVERRLAAILAADAAGYSRPIGGGWDRYPAKAQSNRGRAPRFDA